MDQKLALAILGLESNTLVLGKEYYKRNNIKTVNTFYALPWDLANQPIREFLDISESIKLEYNIYFTRKTVVVILFSKEVLILAHYFQRYKENYNEETTWLEFKCLDQKHLRIEVLFVTIVVKYNKSILDDPKAIQIVSPSIFPNTNLRKFLSAANHKHLLLSNQVKPKKLPTQIVFKHKIKLIAEPKKI